MQLEPIINARFKKFRDQMELNNVPDDVAFEQYANLSILKSHQPDAFNGDNELFDKVNIGGYEDMGIDGIAIKINGIIIRDLSEAEDLTSKFPKGHLYILDICQ